MTRRSPLPPLRDRLSAVGVEVQTLLKEAGLTGDRDIDSGVLASLAGPRTLDLTEERNEILERVEFNVQIVTETPVLIDNESRGRAYWDRYTKPVCRVACRGEVNAVR